MFEKCTRAIIIVLYLGLQKENIIRYNAMTLMIFIFNLQLDTSLLSHGEFNARCEKWKQLLGKLLVHAYGLKFTIYFT